MESQQLIDMQFDRAVEIVQGLPKTGPIQTGYEDKLTMYSLYKQATVGNVRSPRPGIWDMLGRAKWDAWAKHKDLDSTEAKWLYVDALLRVLKKYSDATVARDLVQELESYGGDPSNLVMSGSMSKAAGSESSGSTASEEPAPHLQPHPASFHRQPPVGVQPSGTDDESSVDSEAEAEERDHPSNLQLSNYPRPQSALSSRRYRTPMAGSTVTSPPLPHTAGVPATQPLPGFETPSAFGETSSQTQSMPASTLFNASARYGSPPVHPAQDNSVYGAHPLYRGQSQPVGGRGYAAPLRPASRPTLERAVENVQAHLAALQERLESLETLSVNPQRSNYSLTTGGVSPRWAGSGRGRGSPADRQDPSEWDWDDLGMWSIVLNPMSRVARSLRTLAAFFARSEHRSPTLVVVRRLCLDVSFLLCVLAVVRALWKKSGVRRREVNVALRVLWRAIVGANQDRHLVDRGV